MRQVPGAGMAHAASDPVPGRLYRAGARTLVLSFPIATSLPIPLGIAAPSGIALLAWAFAGLDPRASEGPRCLLLLEAPDDEAASALRAGTLTVATHFRDLAVAPKACGGLDDLPAGERGLLARVVLSDVTPRHVAALADVVGIVPAEAAAPAEDAPEIVFHVKTRDGAIPSSDIPNYLLLRSGPTWSCHRVARARLTAGDPPRASLALETEWGALPDSPTDAVIGLHSGRFVAYRLPAA